MTHRDTRLPAPIYRPTAKAADRPRMGLAVESMRRHMTDEGWQLFEGLERAGYYLFGYALPNPLTDVAAVLRHDPSTVVVQDKREWDVQKGDFREPRARFTNVGHLRDRPDVFRVTVLKDAHQRPAYHEEAAREMGCHAWVVYYHPDQVVRYAPYVRERHLIRTYHTIDRHVVLDYSPKREYGCLLSGAVSAAYPLRDRLVKHRLHLPDTLTLSHPGYHKNGCHTPRFLRFLSSFKVAICTASKYDYALRKIVEATAAGCSVITDLSEKDCLPEIDGNLVRIPSGSSVPFVCDVIQRLISDYNPEKQKYFSDCAKAYYDFREEGRRLAQKIEDLRLIYS